MKIAILDDYQNVVRGLNAFQCLQGHDVTVFNDSLSDETVLIERLKPFEALVLIRERTPITENLLAHLPNLKLISQTGKVSNHIDVALCERYGVTVLEGIGSPAAPAELCWGLTCRFAPFAKLYRAVTRRSLATKWRIRLRSNPLWSHLGHLGFRQNRSAHCSIWSRIWYANLGVGQ